MFTGLIEATASVTNASGSSLQIDLKDIDDDVRVGDSIAVNGMCLTIARNSSGTCTFDVSDETLMRTTLRELKTGVLVDIERALKTSDRIGGHFVTGHIDATGTIEAISSDLLQVSLPQDLRSMIVEKGSIAVDGISLTIASITPRGFTAALIPHTFANTTLHRKSIGANVNVETDILAKYVAALLPVKSRGISHATLEKHGFT